MAGLRGSLAYATPTLLPPLFENPGLMQASKLAHGSAFLPPTPIPLFYRFDSEAIVRYNIAKIPQATAASIARSQTDVRSERTLIMIATDAVPPITASERRLSENEFLPIRKYYDPNFYNKSSVMPRF
ncbi:MAG: hypothetical protein IT427_18360 [Pirellulales bacterium]|nr:hypothetical protein [Pirellulales bacterium]